MSSSFHQPDSSNPLIEALRRRAASVDSIKVVTGFTTPSGLNHLIDAIGGDQFEQKVKFMVVGVLTESAALALLAGLDKFPRRDLFHYGVRFFHRGRGYRPTVHAKILIGEDANGVPAWAYVGSSNMTEFALLDRNVEGGVWIDRTPGTAAALDSIKACVENIRSAHARVFTRQATQVQWRVTAAGEFAYITPGPNLFRFRSLYLVPVQANLSRADFEAQPKPLLESDLVRSTRFEREMKTIGQLILFQFFRDPRDLASGTYFMLPGTLTLANDVDAGQRAGVGTTLGYLNHQRDLPFFYRPQRPTVSDPAKTRQAVFRLYPNVSDMVQEIDLPANQIELLERLLPNGETNPVAVRRLCQRNTIPSAKPVFRKAEESTTEGYDLVELEPVDPKAEKIGTLESVYDDVAERADAGDVGYQEIARSFDEDRPHKEELDIRLRKRQERLIGVEWLRKVSKMLESED